MKLLVTRPLPEPVLERLRGAHEVVLRGEDRPMSEAEAAAALAAYDAILPTLGDDFAAGAFAAAGEIRTRLLANFGVGYNHIDVAAARARGVAVTNTPGVLTDATADIAMTLLLASARRAGEGERLLRCGGWTGFHPTAFLGTEVSGKTLGIVGMGRIGQAVAARCHAGFGMEVVYFNRSEKRLPFEARRADTLEELGGRVDFVVVAVPGGAATHHLIGAGFFRAMRPGGIFINIARGDVVDEAALVAALQQGEIAAAGLDVYEFEPEVSPPLLAMENVVLLPHLGSATWETRVAMGQMAAENILAFFAGRPLLTPV
ncbi:MAG: D-glycerate dehydrogenase [Rhodobacterales bacterium]|nr:MAG: D-glycerate dehydrogenase [Rhodobacterales bacterium]